MRRRARHPGRVTRPRHRRATGTPPPPRLAVTPRWCASANRLRGPLPCVRRSTPHRAWRGWRPFGQQRLCAPHAPPPPWPPPALHPPRPPAAHLAARPRPRHRPDRPSRLLAEAAAGLARAAAAAASDAVGNSLAAAAAAASVPTGGFAKPSVVAAATPPYGVAPHRLQGASSARAPPPPPPRAGPRRSCRLHPPTMHPPRLFSSASCRRQLRAPPQTLAGWAAARAKAAAATATG